jgi:hypothetical protein
VSPPPASVLPGDEDEDAGALAPPEVELLGVHPVRWVVVDAAALGLVVEPASFV